MRGILLLVAALASSTRTLAAPAVSYVPANSTLAFAALRATDAGTYTVTVTNASGTTTGRKATLTVNWAGPA